MRRRDLLAFVGAAPGCALLEKAEPLNPVYLTPMGPERHSMDGSGRSDLALRLRPVRASEHLDKRIVLREQAHRIRFSERARWTVPPAAFVERRLQRVLFEEHGVTRVVGGPGPTLEVTVQAFELALEGEPRARAQLTCLLHDERHAVLRETFAAERPTTLAEGGEVAGPAFAEAMGAVLGEAIDALVARTLPALTEMKRRPHPPTTDEENR